MSNGGRLWACAAVGAYLGVAAFFGNAFYTIPAATRAGAVYVGMTWPAWIKGSPIHIGIPAWSFHFQPKDPAK